MLVLLLLLLRGPVGGHAQTSAFNENEVKAVFLLNFTQFVQWPPQAFPDAQKPITIGILGKDPFGKFLEQIVRDEAVNKRKLVIQHYRRVAEITSCHVLFISDSEAGQLGEILPALKGRSILTVGDTEDFAQRGGMIRFLTEKKRIRLRVNVEAAKAAQLQISSKLLRPAEVMDRQEAK